MKRFAAAVFLAAGVARIPIEVAKKRLLEKGLPSDAVAPAPGGKP